MLDAIKNRHSCRSFLSKEIEDFKLKEIVNAGLRAPSGMNRQEGIIIVINDKELRTLLATLNAFIAKMPQDMDPFYGAPTVLLIAHKKSPLAIYNGAAMIENILLEATNQGLGSCWIHRAYEELKMPIGVDILARCGLDPNEYEGIGHVALGYIKQDNPCKEIHDNRAFYL